MIYADVWGSDISWVCPAYLGVGWIWLIEAGFSWIDGGSLALVHEFRSQQRKATHILLIMAQVQESNQTKPALLPTSASAMSRTILITWKNLDSMKTDQKISHTINFWKEISPSMEQQCQVDGKAVSKQFPFGAPLCQGVSHVYSMTPSTFAQQPFCKWWLHSWTV
jgi:hypothetical protein